MEIELAESKPDETSADLLCLGLFEGEDLPSFLTGAPGAEDAESKLNSLAVVRPGDRRVLVVGLGKRDDFDTERARVAAALAVRQAGRFDATHVAWACPLGGSTAAGLTAGTILASYRFDRYKSKPDEDGDDGTPDAKVERLTLLGAGEAGAIVETARVAALAANRARDLQNLPANVADPAYLADRAREIAAGHDALEVEVLGRAELEAEGMGGILAVSQGSAKEPQLIVLRYSGGGSGSTLGLVGKGVTFDSGGISIKPSAGMELMKKDMSGGAAVLEATGAIAELGLPVDLVTVVPAVENMPSGTAMRPGDIITQLNGKTVEINNTDAEGRLILADALTWCERQGAERIVDVATLTGAVVVALGSTYAGLMANDDGWAEELTAAGEVTGELVWRLPLHPEYKQLTKGTVADLTNAAAKRKAGTIYAGSFLEEFVAEATWAHLDIAGTSWDVGREYVGSGATGFGVRLLVELASRVSSE